MKNKIPAGERPLAPINKKLVQTLIKLDCFANNPYRESALKAVQKATVTQKPLEFLLFTCSTIDATKLFSDKPWEYISLNPAGNNLETDLPNLKNILNILQNIYPIKLKIIIGNTDPYYIYLQQFVNFPENKCSEIKKEFEKRWTIYRNIFEDWLQEKLPNTNLEVISWQAWEKKQETEQKISFEKEFNNLYSQWPKIFSEKDLAWEYRKLITQFEPKKYFSGLTKPNDELLKDWIVRKFCEYAVQGFWLQRAFPNGILLQNEKPSELRSAMYQPLLKRIGKVLPILYFFGVDDEGYV